MKKKRTPKPKPPCNPPTATVTQLAAVLPPIGMIGGDAQGGYIVTGHTDAGTVIERADGSTETLPPAKTPKLPKPGTAFYKAAQAGVKEAMIGAGLATNEPQHPHIRPGVIINDDTLPGPCIVVGRNGDNVTVLSSLGYHNRMVSTLDADRYPPPGSPLDLIADEITIALNHTPGALHGVMSPEPAKAALGMAMDRIGLAVKAVDAARKLEAVENWTDGMDDVWDQLMSAYRAMPDIITECSCFGDTADDHLDMQAGKVLAGLTAFPKPGAWGGPPREAVFPLLAIINAIGGSIEAVRSQINSEAEDYKAGLEEVENGLWEVHGTMMDVIGNAIHETMNTRAADVIKAVKMPTRPAMAKPEKRDLSHFDIREYHALATRMDELLNGAWKEDGTSDGKGKPGITVGITLDGRTLPNGWGMDAGDAKELEDAVRYVRHTAGEALAYAHEELVRLELEGGGA